MSLRGAMDGGKERGGDERGGGRARGGRARGGRAKPYLYLYVREGVKVCCRDDAGLHMYRISMWWVPPRRMRCTQSRVCEACGRAVAAPWRGGQVAVAVAVAGLAGGERTAVAPAWGEMPDAARAAALSRRAYEAATGRGLGQWSGRGRHGLACKASRSVGPVRLWGGACGRCGR
jgi:hypothetical protein